MKKSVAKKKKESVMKESNLRFCRPNHKQYKYFSKKGDETTFLVRASAKMPKVNRMLFEGSQLLKTTVTFCQFFLSSRFTAPQSKKSATHRIGTSSLWHSAFQHVACRSIDSRYHAAPRIYTRRNLRLNRAYSSGSVVSASNGSIVLRLTELLDHNDSASQTLDISLL